MRWCVVAGLLCGLGLQAASAGEPPVAYKAQPIQEAIPSAHYTMGGLVGDRVRANVDRWLTVVPTTDPGLLEMFARRDQEPSPDLVPWAGEFVGKYLISGVQAMRMSDDPKLRATLQAVVDRLVSLQAEDGYLGPWPNRERLLGHWDLWGHDHILLGLLAWYAETGDEKALSAARRIGDLVVKTYPQGGRRVSEAGSPEMNMAIIHGMTLLYRATGEKAYLDMALRVRSNFRAAGNYRCAGWFSEEFYLTPRPRWESLHSLQGMAELALLTHDEVDRTSFLHHWASIRRFDLRNTGGFSSGEQATGSPFANDAIETCCVIAWQAVMIDALRLTGDSTIADELELSTLNAALGAQHPSGAWCTYNTPMAGERGPSHIQIQFQARPTTPHLNCCSVNGPRGYGSLVDWAVMWREGGLVLNYFGPMTARAPLADGLAVTLREETDYPLTGRIAITVEPAAERAFPLWLRIPEWSATHRVEVAGEAVAGVRAGAYLKIERTWKPGDQIVAEFDLALRYEPGDREQAGRASVYRGPILLAADSRFAPVDQLPTLDATRLGEATVVPADRGAWIAVELPTSAGPLRLIDFASAGATSLEGKPESHYTTWLPAEKMRPPRPVAWLPRDRQTIGPEEGFLWRSQNAEVMENTLYRLEIAEDAACEQVVVRVENRTCRWLPLSPAQCGPLKSGEKYWWRIVAENAFGVSRSVKPYKCFLYHPAIPPHIRLGGAASDASGVLVDVPLHGDCTPASGVLRQSVGVAPAPGPDGKPGGAVEFDGKTGLATYLVPEWPKANYSVSGWFQVVTMPTTQYGQIFSGWAAGSDDPLRIFVSGGRLAARIESSVFAETPSVLVETGRWYHVAAVKDGARLTLYLNGQPVGSADAPAKVHTRATDFGLGGNPHYTGGPENLAARLSGFRFFARALAPAEIAAAAANP